jgi:hypothetical protein
MSERREQTLPEGTFIARIDYNMSIWMAYQNCINAPIFGKHVDSFTSMVRILTKMILKSWQDEEYTAETTRDGSPIGFFGAITELLHRRKFFETIEREDLVG